MQHYNFWQALLFSFFSKSLYQDVDQNWRGCGLRYLFVVCFICALPLLYTAHQLTTDFSRILHFVAIQLPTITIKNGEVSIDRPSPFEIKAPETKKTIAIINTTEHVSDIQKTKLLVLLNKNQLIIRTGKDTTKIYSLSDINNTVIDQARINRWINILIGTTFFILYSAAILFYFLPSLLIAFFYAAIAKLFVRTHHLYSELCRLAAVALTPTLIFIGILSALHINLPYRSIVYLILSLSYLTFAIEVNKPHAKS